MPPAERSATTTRVGAVYFDLYGTLVDLGPLDAACEVVVPGHGADFAKAWRAEQIRLTWLRTIMATWVDFERVTGAALRAIATRFGVDPSTASGVLSGAFDALPARPEAPAVIGSLRAAGIRVGVLSNGSRSMIGRALADTTLAGLFDDLLSVDQVRRFKPDPAVYAMAVRASGLEPAEIGFVTANDWDAVGAAAYGFRVAWLRSPGAPEPPSVGAPDPAVATWADLSRFATDSSGM